MLKRLFLCGLLLLGASGARATILIQPAGNNPTSDGAGSFLWNYNVSLEPGAFMSPTDQLVIYDVAGFNINKSSFVPGSSIDGADVFTISQQDSGPPPGPVLPHTDNSGIPNVVLTLTSGPNIRQTDITKGSLQLGTLTVDSTFATGAELNYGSIDRHTVFKNGQPEILPLFAVASAAGPVPEPSTMSMLGVGLLAAMGIAVRRRTRTRR